METAYEFKADLELMLVDFQQPFDLIKKNKLINALVNKTNKNDNEDNNYKD